MQLNSEIIHGSDFKNEMSRFLPSPIQAQTLQKNKFLDFLTQEHLQLLSHLEAIVA